ncbi:MAG TPA: class I SAM-dependent methyltransferase [Sphingomicrobium sp.]|nr:class I SAM-dependent methyltransferase [Sphingomicrobium sp.]
MTEGNPAFKNADPANVVGFAKEWAAFDQSALQGSEYQKLFDGYFAIFPFGDLPPDSEGFDVGCGSGRWAEGVAPRVGTLHCIEVSAEALDVARARLARFDNVRFHLASIEDIPLEDESQDFGYSLGVLHHVPDAAEALRECVRKLKPGAPFLVYVYYALEDRPAWYRGLFRLSDVARKSIARLPFRARRLVTEAIAAGLYYPLARTSRLLESLGADVSRLPLSFYRNSSFYTMRTDALNRFGTAFVKRFSRDEIEAMMESAGLTGIRFSERLPHWVAVGRRGRA